MKPYLDDFVWELTERCNLSCRHCGSDCISSVREAELSRDDAMRVVGDMEQFDIKRIVFSGGEPLLCSYWRELAQAFNHRSELGMVTNGTLLTAETAREMKEYGFNVVSVSVDGLEKTHDNRRTAGNFRQCMNAIRNIREAGLVPAVNTTVTKENLNELPQLQKQLREAGVSSWQVQPAVPSGRMSENRESVPSIEDIRSIIRFAYESNSVGNTPVVFLAETIGYYSVAETLARKIAFGTDKLPVWKGCPAGIKTMGILATGELIGCISLRGNLFRECNVRDLWREGITIADYWNSDKSFKWRRELRPEMLGEKCSDCRYAECCVGGCSNVRYCSNGTVESDNPFCIYSEEM